MVSFSFCRFMDFFCGSVHKPAKIPRKLNQYYSGKMDLTLSPMTLIYLFTLENKTIFTSPITLARARRIFAEIR